MLIVFAGLPGTGKTTISRSVAAELAATYLRIDAIEHAIRNAAVFSGEVGPSGYAVAQSIAETNLVDGRRVVADCVNPVAASRQGWRSVAARVGGRLVEVEVVCSDIDEHRRRVTTRTADIPGFELPSWEAVRSLEYEEWDRPRLILDTSKLSPAEAVARIVEAAGRL